MQEASAGKDTITGHWEMAGLVTTQAMATFPNGFPPEILEPLRTAAGRGLVGNKTASGTAILEELGAHHLASGDLILYTSADSVIQVAAHEEIVPLDELYRICEAARTIADRHHIGRVIARPFVGKPGAFRRTYNRRDFALVPPEPTLLDRLRDAGQDVVGIGKISDIFAGRGLTRSLHSEGNTDGLRLTLEALGALSRGLLFVNLVDFDMLYGHRNDAPGFARALAELDAWLPSFEAALRPGDAAFITADHGNDPTTPGTDHTRERVPILAFGPGLRPAPLGVRASFCDLGQTIADGLGIPPLPRGSSFLGALRS
jgi:phosphopentomutase